MTRLREFWLDSADLAPVALFRIVYGVQLFNWFWQLYPNLPAFFTDEGILPRTQLVTLLPQRYTLLAGAGESWHVAIFWAAGLAVAVAIAVGWHTRVACLLGFVLVSSFEWRQPLMLDGSDIVFRLVPFWLAFTACGNVWSLDALRSGSVAGRGPALPIRLLELQVGWIHLATGLEKLAGLLWLNGTAPYYALQLEHTFGRAYAYPLATQPIVVALMSWGTLLVELSFVPLAMLPFRTTRLLAVAGGVALHGGILVLMNVGNFPVIMLSTLILFLPARWVRGFVDRGSGRVRRLARPAIMARAGDGPRASRTAGAEDSRANARAPAAGPIARRPDGWSAVATAALLAVAAISFATALPEWAASGRPQGELGRAVAFASLDQRWDMFSPNPAQSDGWMVGPATRADGTTYDLFDGGPANKDARWSDPLYTRWAKVFERIANVGYVDYRPEFAQAMCRLRNFHLADGESPLDTFELYYIERTIRPPGEVPTLQEYHLWSHQC